VPLHKLGKCVPHGAKGQDLLDLLHANAVAIPRAVWFLRVFGANEVTGLRHKPAYDPMQYSVEWANVVTSHLKKQLGEIMLPSAPRPTLNIKSVFRSVLADSDSRARWISRFTYRSGATLCLEHLPADRTRDHSLDLLRSFYSEGLVDNRTFLAWLVLQMCTCNLAQAGFVARLADEYLDGIIACRALSRPFVDACLSKISEV
jgi:mediator of RNA polymerase II transcription subunit 12